MKKMKGCKKMSAKNEVKFSLKVVINKDKTKVLFAEVDSAFVDVLLTFLTLPLGTIPLIFENHYGDEEVPVVGSLNSLRKGLEDLDDVHFWTSEGKTMLLNPIRSSEVGCRKLKLNIDLDVQPIQYFTCAGLGCGLDKSLNNITMYYDTLRCSCGKSMNEEIRVYEKCTKKADVDDGVFMVNSASFLICDDLSLVPNVSESIIKTLNTLSLSDTSGVEQRTVTIGRNGIMDLLRLSIISNTPLTDLILSEKRVKGEPETYMKNEETLDRDKKMTVKGMMQKSTNKLLFVQSKADFVDFLFSLLTISLGGVVDVLSSRTLSSVDNLYKSVTNSINEECMTCCKSVLLKPKLPPFYLSKYQILPITEQTAPRLYYNKYDGFLTDGDCNAPGKKSAF